MTLKQHSMITAAASIVLIPFWNWMQIAVFAVGSILIDIDHYLFFVLRQKKFGIKAMFDYHDSLFKKKDQIPYAGICVFHTLDFFLLVGILSIFFPILIFLLSGLVFHFLIDLFHLYRHNYL